MFYPSNARGFSLLELLLVLVILGVLYGVASVSINSVRESPATQAAEQFKGVIRLTQNEAVIRSSVLGVLLTIKGYEVMEQTAPQQWQALESIHPQQPPDPSVVVKLQLEGIDVVLNQPEEVTELSRLLPTEDSTRQPQVVILPTGEMTPFTVLWSEGQTQLTQQWDGLGRMVDANSTP